ncbi:MAG: DNA recombination protein RmuC, partial [Phycisphaerales bacterium]|nr:DNA recombination protein RmuC [Phycisphaerales bacterium]
MDLILPIVLGVVALALGAVLLLHLPKARRLRDDLRERTDRIASLEADLAETRRTSEDRLLRVTELEARLDASDQRRADDEARLAQLKETFDALAGKTLKDAQASFLQLANENFEKRTKESQADLDARKKAVESLVEPIGKTLEQTKLKLEAIEKARTESFATLTEHIRQVQDGSTTLRDETARLTKALARPDVRGRYGEIQLRRVVELAGMTSYCDFTEQTTTSVESGTYRPDMVVRLPNERMIVVDAKTNTQAYLDAIGATTDVERDAKLDAFATHVN